MIQIFSLLGILLNPFFLQSTSLPALFRVISICKKLIHFNVTQFDYFSIVLINSVQI